MSVDFSFTAKKLNDKYVLVARNYGVVVRAPELLSGVRELEERVRAVVRDYGEAGIPPIVAQGEEAPDESTAAKDVGRARASRRPDGYATQYAFFLSKVAIVLAFVAVFMVVEVAVFYKFLGPNSAIGLLLRHPAQFVVQLGDRADAMTPSEIDELKLAIRRIAAKAVPLIEEARSPREALPPAATDAPNAK